MDLERLKPPLKAIRAWPPLNLPVTSALRASLRPFGGGSPALARFLPRVGVVRTPLPKGGDLQMWSAADDQIASSVFWSGWAGHEPETCLPFYQLAACARVTLDVGAHVGYFTLLAGLANPHGSIFAFEPLRRVYERLVHNVALNGLENVTCLPLAVGSKPEKSAFFHVTDSIPSSSSLSKDFMETVVGNKRLVSSEVEVTSIDVFVETRQLPGVDLIKIDTEATEDDVFRGMERTLERYRPVIICEVMRQQSGDVIESILTPLDYEFSLLTEHGPIQYDHIRPHPLWRNFSFIPRSAPRRERGPDLQ